MSDEHKRREADSESTWHLDKKVSWGHIIATIVLSGTVYGWGDAKLDDMELRLSLIEKDVSTLSEMKDDIKDIKDVVGLLPSFMERKDLTDTRQWDVLNELRSKSRND